VTRIVAGSAGGRRLAVPPGERTRPTSDRAREALFGTLSGLLDLDGVRVLDLYAGSGAVEQMMLAEYCAPHFTEHVPVLTKGLRRKLDTLMESLNEQFGTAAEFEEPKGGIFLWVKLPDNVDTMKLYQPALKAGVAINPGPEWSVDRAHSKSRMRLCFAGPSHDEIREGIAVLAEVCHREFGVPVRIGNVSR